MGAFQSIQQRVDSGLRRNAPASYIGIHQFNSFVPHLNVVNPGAKIAFQLGGGRTPVQSPHADSLGVGHGIAQGNSCLLPEAGVEPFGIQNHAVHIKENPLHLGDGLEDLVCHSVASLSFFCDYDTEFKRDFPVGDSAFLITS